jgi:hypothetical protein
MASNWSLEPNFLYRNASSRPFFAFADGPSRHLLRLRKGGQDQSEPDIDEDL